MHRIRPATSNDFAALAPLFAAVDALHIEHHPERFRSPGHPPRSDEYLQQVVHSAHQEFLVAELDGALLGVVHIAVYESPAVPLFVPRLCAVISDLVVAGPHRSRGIGRRLLIEAEGWARRQGATSVDLSVYAFNEGARRFYERAGYGTLSRQMTKPLP
jgi:ribosomal protein S18 acetylase RimI-like enzyme